MSSEAELNYVPCGPFTERSTVTTKEMAILFGVTSKTISTLRDEGTLVPAERGTLRLIDSVQGYIGKLRRNSKRQSAAWSDSPDDESYASKKQKADADWKRARADIEQLKLQELKGQMHRSEDVAAMTEELIFTIRSALLALPGRLAVDVASCRTAPEASDVIEREVKLLMKDLSMFKYDPQKYKERVKERMQWSLDHGEEDEDEDRD